MTLETPDFDSNCESWSDCGGNCVEADRLTQLWKNSFLTNTKSDPYYTLTVRVPFTLKLPFQTKVKRASLREGDTNMIVTFGFVILVKMLNCSQVRICSKS